MIITKALPPPLILGTPLCSDKLLFYDIGSVSSSSKYSLSQLFPATWPPRGDDVTSRRSVASSARRTSVMRSRSSGWRRQHPVITRLTSGGQQRGGSGESPDWTCWMTCPHAPTQQLRKNRPEISTNNSIESTDIEIHDKLFNFEIFTNFINFLRISKPFFIYSVK